MKTLKTCVLTILLTGLAAASQYPPVTIEKVEIDTPNSPIYQDTDGNDTVQISGIPLRSTADRRWLRVLATYESTPEWLDRLMLEFYVLIPTAQEGTLLFKGVVPYANIPHGRDHIAEMYMHFNTYERFYRRSSGPVEYAVVASIDGETVSVYSSIRDNTEWFRGMKIHPCGLLNRQQTPFRVINSEEYQALDLCNWEE